MFKVVDASCRAKNVNVILCHKLADQNYQHYISILVCYTIIDTAPVGMVIDMNLGT